MIIQCESCNTKFRVGDDKVKPPGIKVRCSKCGEVFFFEYSIHEELSGEAEPNPFDDVSEDEQVQPDIPNEIPEVQNKPDIDPQPELSDFTPTVTNVDQVSSTETEEVQNESIGQSDSFQNLEIDPLDDISETPESQPDSSTMEVNNDQEGGKGTSTDKREGSDFQSQDLLIDQDVLEQTYTKGTVASQSEIKEPKYVATSRHKSVRRYRGDRENSKIKKFFGWFFSIILIVLLFLVSLFILNESKIYPNDYYNRFDNFARSLFLGDKGRALNKNIRIQDVTGSWQSSKYGQVYIVQGTAANISVNPINYLKLRVNYTSEGDTIFQQELYAGNTLSKREIKNNSFKSLQSKLNRKNGDINYEDTNNLDGLNFDIQPKEKIPFYSIFPAKEKILGLKYRVEVIGYDSVEINEDP